MFIIACNSNNKKDTLFGIWSTYETGRELNVLTFYKDSLTQDAFGGGFHTNAQWKIDEKKIYLKNVRLLDTILKKEFIYQYELNRTLDTLLLEYQGNHGTELVKLKK